MRKIIIPLVLALIMLFGTNSVKLDTEKEVNYSPYFVNMNFSKAFINNDSAHKDISNRIKRIKIVKSEVIKQQKYLKKYKNANNKK